MKIIENNYKDTEEIVCPCCKPRLEYNKSDVYTYEGDEFITCPCCKSNIMRTPHSASVDHLPKYNCSHCYRTFDAESYEGANGGEYAVCPYCGNEEMVGKGIELTADNVEYPKHFFSFKNGKPVDDAQITEWTRDCVSKLDKGIDFLYTGTGNACVIAFKGDEDEVVVIATKDYSEASFQIPHEKY